MADDKKKKPGGDGGMGQWALFALLIGVVGWQVANYQLRSTADIDDTTEQGVVRHLDKSKSGERPVTWVDLAEKMRRGEFGTKAPESIGGVHR